jgi:hypothetical protein
MSNNEWRNTEYRNIRFVNKCSQDIYVGSKMPAGENINDSVCNIGNYDDINTLPYSAISEGDKTNAQPCKDFKQIIAKIEGTESAGAGGGVYNYLLQLFNNGGHNACNSTNDWCRNSFQVFPMTLNDGMSTNEINEEFDNSSLYQGLTEFTFGADPTDELKGGDDNYDISVIIRHGACSAHSNPYENDYGYANTNPECQTNPSENNNILPFNNDVAYNTVDLAKYSNKGTNSQDSGCSKDTDKGCTNEQKTVPFYGCGIPRVYTPNGSSTEYTLKWGAPESDQWEVYTSDGDEKVEEPNRTIILDEIREEIVKCSYVQSKMNNKDESADSIFNFIPFELKALEDDGISTYEGCSTGTEPLKCEPATDGDPSSLETSCHRGYSFQYDDFVAGITCRPPINTESDNPYSTYEITYCPNGDIPNPNPPNPNPPNPNPPNPNPPNPNPPNPNPPNPNPPNPNPPGPNDRAKCSTLRSCIIGMIPDPLMGNNLCSGILCDTVVDSFTCCKNDNTDPSNVSSNSQTEEESGTSNRASLSNDNTRFVSQIDDRPMYDGSSLDKKTSHTNIMQSSNYNPVGIDEGSGYSFLSNISSSVSGLGSKSNSIGLQPNNFYW